MIHAYVDGSFSNDKCGYGVVICDGPYSLGSILYSTNGVVEGETHRQIGGELKAAMVVIWWMIRNQINEATVVYDYDGIRKWVTGEWHAKKPLTRTYQIWMRNKIEEFKLLIYWQHVRGHTGHPGNEKADQLAKEATS